MMSPEDARFRILRLIEKEPELDQRRIADELGLSLGKVNYCVRALVDKGFVKFGNFRRSTSKSRYRYQLTPAGVSEKLRQTNRFLDRKMQEYEMLREEIEQLSSELDQLRRSSSA